MRLLKLIVAVVCLFFALTSFLAALALAFVPMCSLVIFMLLGLWCLMQRDAASRRKEVDLGLPPLPESEEKNI